MSERDLESVDWARTEAIAFGDKLLGSEAFSVLFREGMKLIEETANYLDGPGREASRAFDRTGALTYATESMRLTTRLMQLASWLLLQRAVNEGELSKNQAKIDAAKVSIGTLGKPELTLAAQALPDPLRELVERSLRLHERIAHLDRLLYASEIAPAADNPVSDSMARLAAAFPGKAG